MFLNYLKEYYVIIVDKICCLTMTSVNVVKNKGIINVELLKLRPSNICNTILEIILTVIDAV